MRRRISGLLAVVGVVWFLAAQTGRAQDYQNYEVPPSTGYFPGPLGHPRYEDGGFFVAVEFVYWNQTNPLRNQNVAIRGFVNDDGTATLPNQTPGTFNGSGNLALSTSQIQRQEFQPGTNLVAGWRFENGWVLQAGWLHLMESRYAAGASIIPQAHAVGPLLDDTFLFSGVFNFTPAYAGPQNRTGTGNPGAVFGIWNGASEETIQYVQRFDQYDMTLRVPIWQTASHRQYALIGPRIVHFFDRFTWRTTAEDVTGITVASDAATYSNTVSNTMYGLHAGGGHDWWLGNTPIGGFSVSVDGEAALYYDFVKERAKYELGDRSTAATNNHNTGTFAPGLQGKVSLWYYPVEAIQIRIGYDVLAFFNTISSPYPIDFNFGQIRPAYQSQGRLLSGFSLGIGFVF